MYKKEKRKRVQDYPHHLQCACAKLMGLHILLVLIFRILLHKLSATEKNVKMLKFNVINKSQKHNGSKAFLESIFIDLPHFRRVFSSI
jgi:hypothetical protein